MSFLARLTCTTALRMSLVRGMSTEAAPVAAATATAITQKVAIPRPRGQFDSPEPFLKAIGRGCEKFTDKFKDWDHLFRANSSTMKHDLGIGPKHRKWILMWANKFRLGINPYLIQTSKKHTMKRSERLARAKRRRHD
ncbi:IGR protein motif-domain-containing protein [Kickxella alabastrina]|uniref:IGR protein motif-domain-containing protein n=1 Tax=Kickxella alabastrina TaxID=61397 RepID=UPI002220694E|nr:IGR protein motif-domain-containing protein [Kickxella alabastrina]KAI7834055.1 IGR protein motif-domain-containing protein [Kickxella alabastrina]KAJ1935400.1 hypothetical protein GGF37_006006 [Kickxella alabastrina]